MAYGIAGPPQQAAQQPYQPYMRLVGNEELQQREEQERQAATAQSTPVITGLAGHITACKDEAVQAKELVQERLLKCQRQRAGIYEPDKLAKIKEQGGSEIFMQLTSVKCRALESWIRDILRPPSDKPWGLQGSPIPELPPATQAYIQREVVMQYMQLNQEPVPNLARIREIKDKAMANLKQKLADEAEKTAQLMEDRINDEFLEGQWYESLDDVVSDIATFPTAFMTGPIIRKRKAKKWVQKNAQGSWHLIIEEKLVKEYERISPYDVYPSPTAKNLNEGYVLIREIITGSELSKCAGLKGYDSEAIKEVIKNNPSGLRTWLSQDSERSLLESKDREQFSTSYDGKYECWKFYGAVRGELLRQWGMSEQEVPDESVSYEICAKMIGSYVIRAVINPDPLGKRPLYYASFEKVPDSIWGKAPPELMADVQEMCNGCARHLANNMAMASGPQVWIDKDRVADKDIESLSPWRIWQILRDETGSGAAPMGFFQPNPMADVLLKVFDYFFKLAGEVTGIPNYVYGMSDTSGAAKTASGLSMLMNSASKGIKMVIFHIDDGIITPSVKAHCDMLMLYDEDEAIKGDVQIIPKGSTALVMEEQRQLRLNEFMQVAASPVYAQIFGRKGLAGLLREAIKGLRMPMDSLIPSDEEIEAQEEQQKTIEIVMKISAALGIPPQVIVQALSQGQGGPMGGPGQPGQGGSQGGQQDGAQQMQRPEQQNPAGMPMGGAGLGTMMAGRVANGGGMQL